MKNEMSGIPFILPNQSFETFKYNCLKLQCYFSVHFYRIFKHQITKDK